MKRIIRKIPFILVIPLVILLVSVIALADFISDGKTFKESWSNYFGSTNDE